MGTRDKFTVRARIGVGGASFVLTLQGREAWALAELVEAGNQGCTPIDTPGPRWSDYVFKLRHAGIAIETIHEGHGGTFAGRHARYVLRSPVEILELHDHRQIRTAPVIPLEASA